MERFRIHSFSFFRWQSEKHHHFQYSEENGLAIDFPEDQANSCTLVSASADAIELRNDQGQLFHFIPAPYGGN